MKDSEFIELLNLYLDHEISAEDAARLEAEVQGNPARRRVYQDYCRMQKACKVLAQDFATEPAAAPEKKIVAFADARASQRRRQFAVLGSLTAAAACLALAFVIRTAGDPATSPAASAVVTTEAPAPQQVSQPGAVVASNQPTATRGGIEHRSFDEFSLRNQQREAIALASVQNDPNFAWMQDVRLAPLQTATNDAVRFNVDGAVQTNDRTYSSEKKPLPNDVKWIGYRFQK